MELIMLGTGNAVVTQCYNTCFVLREGQRYFMVDGGGGNAVLKQLKSAGLNWMDMREIFITHKHIDHLLGVLWMMRMICQHMSRGQYSGQANLYGHAEVIALLQTMAAALLGEKETQFIGSRLHLIPVEDGAQREILGRTVTFFDIQSTKAKQFGFCMALGGGKKLTCCGDEPYHPCEKNYADGAEWLLHEAFCLHAQADLFHPYEKHHSTVKDACQLAEALQVKNLLLYHTEDRNIENRKALYLAEGKPYYHGTLWVPDDLERIQLT